MKKSSFKMIFFYYFWLINYVESKTLINPQVGVIETELPNDLLVTRGVAKTTITVVNKIAIGEFGF